jgi:hypothetical protein
LPSPVKERYIHGINLEKTKRVEWLIEEIILTHINFAFQTKVKYLKI